MLFSDGLLKYTKMSTLWKLLAIQYKMPTTILCLLYRTFYCGFISISNIIDNKTGLTRSFVLLYIQKCISTHTGSLYRRAITIITAYALSTWSHKPNIRSIHLLGAEIIATKYRWSDRMMEIHGDSNVTFLKCSSQKINTDYYLVQGLICCHNC